MKLDIKIPDGGELHFEKEPMSMERFQTIVYLIAGLGGGAGVLLFFRMLTA